jgi:hypothetical protein
MSEISEDGPEEDDIEDDDDDDVQTVMDEDDFEADMADAESLLQAYTNLPHAHAPVAADPTLSKTSNVSRNLPVDRQKSLPREIEPEKMIPKHEV